MKGNKYWLKKVFGWTIYPGDHFEANFEKIGYRSFGLKIKHLRDLNIYFIEWLGRKGKSFVLVNFY